MRRTPSGLALEVATAVATAALIAVAALVADSAAGHWEAAAREETRWSAAAVEDARTVYLDEAPRALSLTLAEIRRDTYRRVLGTGSDRLGDESEVAGYAGQLARVTSGQAGVVAERYRLDGGGYDVNARLGDLTDAEQVGGRDAVEESLAAGDARQRTSWVLALLCVPCVVVFVVLRRRPGRRAATPPDEPDVIPDPWQVRGRGWVAWGALAAWLLVALVPVVQVEVGGRSARATAEASRLATQVTAEIELSQLHASLRNDVSFTGLELTSAADARDVAAVGQEDVELARWAAAEREVVARWSEAATAMTAAPAFEDGIDPALVAAINSDQDDWEQRGDEQAVAFETASQLGSSETFLAVALLLAALAATGFSSMGSRGGRRVAEAASMLLLVCALTASAAGVGVAI
jgi:hypothetical protein